MSNIVETLRQRTALTEGNKLHNFEALWITLQGKINELCYFEANQGGNEVQIDLVKLFPDNVSWLVFREMLMERLVDVGFDVRTDDIDEILRLSW